MASRSIHSTSSISLGLVALAVAGCSDGGGTAPESSPARVDSIVASVTAQGDVPVEFRLTDADSDPVSVELRYSLDGGRSWKTGTTRESLLRMTSSPEGTRHLIHWASLEDLGFRIDEQVLVEVRVRGQVQTGNGLVARAGSDDDSNMDAVATSPDNLPAAADRVESWMLHLGPLEVGHVEIMRRHDLVVLDPNQPSVTRGRIATIQRGVDGDDPTDDVIVLARVMVGEDPRTVGIDDLGLRGDPRFTGDGSGPRVDPRGPRAAGATLQGLDPAGDPSTADGFAAWYLDDNSVDQDGIGDGIPDRNPRTDACFVNLGAPGWFETVDAMRSDGPDGFVGLEQALAPDTEGGLGFDGVYLDGIDTCAPNLWTWAGSPVQSEFEWTSAGYLSFLLSLRRTHPDALVMQNRGLFFFNPALAHYVLQPGPYLDFVLFSSYRLDANTGQSFDPYWFADNKYNFMPKLQAEANRKNGFQVLSLGYAAGPGIRPETLLGASEDGLAELLADIDEAQRVAGFRHYLTDVGNLLVNDFVATHAVAEDTEPPVWSSSYNEFADRWPEPPGRPDPRVGLQDLQAGIESVTLRWDVALDQNPVHYVAYFQDEPIRFHPRDDDDGDALEDAERIVLDPMPGEGYADGSDPDCFAYEARIPGLRANRSYWFLLRAVDSEGNEEHNRNVLHVAVPARRAELRVDGDFDDWKNVPVLVRDDNDVHHPDGPDWKEIRVAHDADFLYVHATSYDRFDVDGGLLFSLTGFRILIDADDDPHTGFVDGLTGAELAVVGRYLVRQRRGFGDDSSIQMLDVSGRKNLREVELRIPLVQFDRAIGRTARRIRLLFHNRADNDRAPDSGYASFELHR